jgi:hypothetical protein
LSRCGLADGRTGKHKARVPRGTRAGSDVVHYFVEGAGAGVVGVVGVVVLDGGVVVRGAVVVVGGDVTVVPDGVRSTNVKAMKPIRRAATMRPMMMPVALGPPSTLRRSRATPSRSYSVAMI